MTTTQPTNESGNMLTKTTINFAARRNIAITEYTDTFAGNRQVIEIADLEDDEAADEYILAYRYNKDGSLSYMGSCFNGDNDAPAHISTDAELRQLVECVAWSKR